MTVSKLNTSLRRHVAWILGMSIVLVGGVGGWAATSSLSSAIVGEGTVVVDENVKKIQHRDGGIVKELLVREGQSVAAGDVLVTLDPTMVKANLKIVESALAQLYVRRARLTAERLGNDTFSQDVLKEKNLDISDSKQLVEVEATLFRTRNAAFNGRRKQLQEQLVRLQHQIEGYSVQIKALEEGLALTDEELESVERLYKMKITTIQAVNELRRKRVELEGDRGAALSERAQTEGKVNEVALQILQINEDRQAESSKDMTDVEAKIAENEQRRITYQDQLQRLNVTAPIAGRIYQLAVHTVGGVVAPGDVLMLLSPDERVLTVEVKIAGNAIDQVHPGQIVDIRFSAFDQRTTPEVTGMVASISPDIIKDERTGSRYYPVRVNPLPESMAQLKGLSLYPGMPAEAFIKIADRKVFSYLAKPLTDQIARAFREE